LIAQGIAVRSAKVGQLNPHVSVLNFHAARPEAVLLNYGLNRVIANDETGGGNDDAAYRIEAWQFLLAGGAVFDHLDFSFTCARPDGTASIRGAPGGGGPALRRQLTVLKTFLEGFDFLRMRPDAAAVRGLPTGVKCQALVDFGNAYAIHLAGGSQARLEVELPAGVYQAEWMDTKSGSVLLREAFQHAGGMRAIESPPYQQDVALSIRSPVRRPFRAVD
jgi:hypothetical protein